MIIRWAATKLMPRAPAFVLSRMTCVTEAAGLDEGQTTRCTAHGTPSSRGYVLPCSPMHTPCISGNAAAAMRHYGKVTADQARQAGQGAVHCLRDAHMTQDNESSLLGPESLPVALATPGNYLNPLRQRQKAMLPLTCTGESGSWKESTRACLFPATVFPSKRRYSLSFCHPRCCKQRQMNFSTETQVHYLSSPGAAKTSRCSSQKKTLGNTRIVSVQQAGIQSERRMRLPHSLLHPKQESRHSSCSKALRNSSGFKVQCDWSHAECCKHRQAQL